MRSKHEKPKSGLMDGLISELLSSENKDILNPDMFKDEKIAKNIPLRYKIIAAAFVNKGTLNELNAFLVSQSCEQLYARNPYEATLIYAFNNGLSYDEWRRLLDESEDIRSRVNDEPILSSGRLSLSDIRKYVAKNSGDSYEEHYVTMHRTKGIQDQLSAASSDRKELLKFLLRNANEFSFVREITRYYFCKYLMYFLETRKRDYCLALGSGQGIARAFSRLSVFKVQSALSRKKFTPAEAYALIDEAPVSLSAIYNEFQSFYFEYTTMDWMNVLLERYDIYNLSTSQKRDVANYLRNYNPSLSEKDDEEVISWQQAEMERRDSEADFEYSLDNESPSAPSRVGENFLRKVLRGSVDLDRTTFLSFLLFFDKESDVPEEQRINESRLRDILSSCGFPVLNSEREIDDFLIDYMNADDPMSLLLQEAEIMAMSQENFYLYKSHLASKSKSSEWEHLL
jgi:hypothetical protein